LRAKTCHKSVIRLTFHNFSVATKNELFNVAFSRKKEPYPKYTDCGTTDHTVDVSSSKRQQTGNTQRQIHTSNLRHRRHILLTTANYCGLS